MAEWAVSHKGFKVRHRHKLKRLSLWKVYLVYLENKGWKNSKKISANIDAWTYNPRLLANLIVIPSVSTAFYLNLNQFSSLLFFLSLLVSCELDECLFSSVASFKALKSQTSLCYLGSELTSNISLFFWSCRFPVKLFISSQSLPCSRPNANTLCACVRL